MIEGLPQRLLSMSRLQKRMFAAGADVMMCLVSVQVAYYLRIGYWLWPSQSQWLPFLVAIIVAIPLFLVNGFYRTIFRYSGWPALQAVARAGLAYTIIFSTVFTLTGVPGVPRTLGLIQPIVLFLIVGASRATIRMWLGGAYSSLFDAPDRKRVLIYGAGSAGRQLAAALSDSRDMLVVGFIDDGLALEGSALNGKTIHSSRDIRALTARLDINVVLLAIPSASRKRRNEILADMRAASVSVRTLPGVADIASGKVTVNDLRDLDVEDLLGRGTVLPDIILMSKNIAGKTVLVTGAGGSIGGELCRQILDLKPVKLLLVDISEFALYSIHQELLKRVGRDSQQTQSIVPLLASVVDESRMDCIIATWVPDTVYHAAAYKHVPMVEHNPTEGVRNNVFGTLVSARVAARHNVDDFVLVSTDKAVRPTNVMGTTKRLSEMVLQSMALQGGHTRFSMVRFGNVLGSSGSVVPLFRDQIKHGGPVTITHRDMTRYFMTIPEAAQLVIQAGAMALGGEVFILEMGAPVRIFDLAHDMIHLSGLSVQGPDNPLGDISIEEIGLRPGEKLYEELLIGDNPMPTSHPRVMKANDATTGWDQLFPALEELREEIERSDTEAVRRSIRALVPEFEPERQLVDWVSLERALG